MDNKLTYAGTAVRRRWRNNPCQQVAVRRMLDQPFDVTADGARVRPVATRVTKPPPRRRPWLLGFVREAHHTMGGHLFTQRKLQEK